MISGGPPGAVQPSTPGSTRPAMAHMARVVSALLFGLISRIEGTPVSIKLDRCLDLDQRVRGQRRDVDGGAGVFNYSFFFFPFLVIP